MSILNVIVEPKRVLLCTDTEGFSPEGTIIEASKIIPLPLQNAAAGFRGLSTLLIAFTPALTAYSWEFDRLIEELPQTLADLTERVRPHHHGTPADFGFELVVAGFSQKAQQMACHLFLRKQDSNAITVHAIRSSYWSPCWPGESLPPDITHDRTGLAMMAMRQSYKARSQKPAIISGGGRCFITEIQPGRITIEKAFDFPTRQSPG